MNKNTFDVLILNGRPAAGKSEIIDFLKKVPVDQRIERFHIGEFEEIDDFPILFERFEDDELYEKFGQERMISHAQTEYNGKIIKAPHFKGKYFWNFLIEKLNRIYLKKLRDNHYYHNTKTSIIEFARGKEHGGWKEAYQFISQDILDKAATIYIDVSYEESQRRNKRRYNPEKPDSILQHAVPFDLLEKLYKESDWEEFRSENSDYLSVGGVRIPYGIFKNEPEVTDQPEKIATHLEAVTSRLWQNYCAQKRF